MSSPLDVFIGAQYEPPQDKLRNNDSGGWNLVGSRGCLTSNCFVPMFKREANSPYKFTEVKNGEFST